MVPADRWAWIVAFVGKMRAGVTGRSVFGRGLRLSLVLLMTLGLAGCLDRYAWHQKLTVVVETPSGEVSGTSVIEIGASYGSQPLSPNEVWYGITGEATVVEVAPGRYLFALLDRSEERYYRAMREQIPTRDRGKWLKLIPNMNEVAVLEPKNYPMLVTFGNIDNPKSVRKVDPANLAATFGPGFRLSEITLEITDEPVTEEKIESLLGWWLRQATDDKSPPPLRVPNKSPRGYTTVGILDFVRGIKWSRN